MIFIRNSKYYLQAGRFLGTKDVSLMRKYVFLLNAEEREDFITLLHNYSQIYTEVLHDDLINSLLNVKINEKFNNRPNTLYSKDNIKSITDLRTYKYAMALTDYLDN